MEGAHSCGKNSVEKRVCNLSCLNTGSSEQCLSDSPLCPRKPHVLLLRGFLMLFPGSAPEWPSLHLGRLWAVTPRSWGTENSAMQG